MHSITILGIDYIRSTTLSITIQIHYSEYRIFLLLCLSDAMLALVMLNVIILSVVAPLKDMFYYSLKGRVLSPNLGGQGRHDIRHNDTHHNNIQHYDIQHNDIQHNDIQHNDIQHNNKSNTTLCITTLTIMVECFNTEC